MSQPARSLVCRAHRRRLAGAARARRAVRLARRRRRPRRRLLRGGRRAGFASRSTRSATSASSWPGCAIAPRRATGMPTARARRTPASSSCSARRSMAMHATESSARRSPRHAVDVSRRVLRGRLRRDADVARGRRSWPVFVARASPACELVERFGGELPVVHARRQPRVRGAAGHRPGARAPDRGAARPRSTAAGSWPPPAPSPLAFAVWNTAKDGSAALLAGLGLPGPRRVAPAVRGVGVLPVPVLRERAE